MKRRRKIITIVVVLVLVGACGAGVAMYGGVVTGLLGELRGQNSGASTPILTENVVVRRGNLDETVHMLGTAYAPSRAALSFQTPWGQVAEVLVRPGDKVQAGSPLVRLDPTAARSKVESAQRKSTSITFGFTLAESSAQRAAAGA